jgi:hypothetical protein
MFDDSEQSMVSPIIGHSMGGHIAAAAVETETLMTANNVVYYSGAVPMCGVVGDLYNYFQGYIKAAEQLAGYPATSFPNDPDVWVDVTLPAIKEALWVDFDTSANIMTSQGEKLKRILMNLSGGRRPLFNPDEMIAAFEAMIDWAEHGTVPEGDEILDPAVLADPFFGCTFTTVDRIGMPSCTPEPT